MPPQSILILGRYSEDLERVSEDNILIFRPCILLAVIILGVHKL